MIGNVAHIGVTVSDIDRSIDFYQNVLGFQFLGEMVMDDEATGKLFARPGCRARVAYLSGDKNSPPVELIQFTNEDIEHQATDLFRTSVSEICFTTEDIWADYRRLLDKGVEFISEPQPFDFTAYGFGKSYAVYLRDPDGVILELTQPL